MKAAAKKDYFDLLKVRYKKCLEPTGACEAEAINAHSIQNARVFDVLAQDGHLLKSGLKHSDMLPTVQLERMGRNKASTFKGLCAEHDQAVFRPIDTQAFDAADVQHLFLLAYRSVLYELHADLQAAVKLQLGFQAAVARGAVRGEIPTPQGMLATSWLCNAIDCHDYKRKFDHAYLASAFDAVEHQVLHFSGLPPTVAASTLFSLDDIEWPPDDVARVALNVFPDEDGTVAIFSYLREERPYAMQYLGRLLEAKDDYQRYLMSKLVLRHCENFVISPAYYDTWPGAKREAVQDFFKRTLLNNDHEYEDEHLYLF